ncbi:MAG: hypothetical protein II258_00165, partial [Spirochaetales bacterium]|nr:hypothetical protein [Spirochaetales bacterium]
MRKISLIFILLCTVAMFLNAAEIEENTESLQMDVPGNQQVADLTIGGDAAIVAAGLQIGVVHGIG